MLLTNTRFGRTFLLTLTLLITTIPALGFALPFVNFGFKGGVGTSFVTGTDLYDEADSMPFAIGGAARFDLAFIQLEGNVLYQNVQFTSKDVSLFNINALQLSLLGRFDLSPVPFLKLTVGTGIEQRSLLEVTTLDKLTLSEDLYNSQLSYLPISVCADFSIPLLGTVGGELRYSHQMSEFIKAEPDLRFHTFMVYLHAFL